MSKGAKILRWTLVILTMFIAVFAVMCYLDWNTLTESIKHNCIKITQILGLLDGILAIFYIRKATRG